MDDFFVMGIGQMGRLFASGALRAGLRVTPITRGAMPTDVLRHADPSPLLVAVGESAFSAALESLPPAWREHVICLQNELFPSSFRGYPQLPSVVVPWLLQKAGLPTQVARVTPCYGRYSELMLTLLKELGLPARLVANERELCQALVDKYTFVLSINTLGVLRNRTLGTWLQEDEARVHAIAREAAALGAALCGPTAVDTDVALAATVEGMVALASMEARGRTALARVQRAVRMAETLGVGVPLLKASLDAAS